MTRKTVLHAAEFRALRDRIYFHGEVDKHGSRIGEGFQEHLGEASRIAADIGHACRRLRGPEFANGFDRSGVGSVAVIMVEPEPRALRHGWEFRQVRIDGLPGGVKSGKTRGFAFLQGLFSAVESRPAGIGSEEEIGAGHFVVDEQISDRGRLPAAQTFIRCRFQNAGSGENVD